MTKLSVRDERMLKSMADIADDLAWLVSGHNRNACHKLVKLGFAICRGSDGALSEAFTITEAGRAALKAPPEDGQ